MTPIPTDTHDPPSAAGELHRRAWTPPQVAQIAVAEDTQNFLHPLGGTDASFYDS